jgi:hypothetical protein
MHPTLIAAVCCALTGTASPVALNPTPPPLVQNWSDTGLIAMDDDWARVPAIVGHRGDGMVTEPGVDPRAVLSDGSTTPVDVTANRTDPGAVGLAAGVAEFELPDPVVAIEGSATAGAPHLVVALDTGKRAEIRVRLVLRDLDASTADAVAPVALQYRVGSTGDFANVPDGYVADATTGPGEATAVTELQTVLPAAVHDQSLVHLRVITTDANGRDEWVGVDDIDVSATTLADPGDCGGTDPPSQPGPAPVPVPSPPPEPAPVPEPVPGPGPDPPRPELTGLTLSPETFTPARRGPAIARRGRAGTGLRFRLSKPALVRFHVIDWGEGSRFHTSQWAEHLRSQAMDRAEHLRFQALERDGRLRFQTTDRGERLRFPATDRGRRAALPMTARPQGVPLRLRPARESARFQVRGRPGLNRMRFTGRIRGRALSKGVYILTAVAIDRAGRTSAPAAARFRIGRASSGAARP